MKINNSALKNELKALHFLAKMIDPILARKLDDAIKTMPDTSAAKVIVRIMLASGATTMNNYPMMKKLGQSD